MGNSDINENNFKQILFNYACEKYGRKFQEFYDKFYDEFPDKYEDLDEELHYKNFTDWLMIEKPLPSTGKTIVEEYVDEHPGLDEEMRQKLLQMKNVVRSKLRVVSKKGRDLEVKDITSKKVYKVKLYSDNPQLTNGNIITGRIHQFGNSYRFAGAYSFQPNFPFIADTEALMDTYEEHMVEEAESIIVSETSKLTAILNKYPFQWVDGICNQLSIDSRGKKDEKVKLIAYELNAKLRTIVANLPKNAKEALKLVLGKDGIVRYNQLNEFDDEITFWWNEKPINSTIGILRLHGLLAVGKMPAGGRLYRVALVPSDIREKLAEIIKMENKNDTQNQNRV